MVFYITNTNPVGAQLEGAYDAIKDFVVLDSSGENQVGFQRIDDQFDRYVLAGQWFSNPQTVTTQNVYSYCWAEHREVGLSTGKMTGYFEKTGNEVLDLSFPAALGAPKTLHLLEYTYSWLECFKGDIKVLS